MINITKFDDNNDDSNPLVYLVFYSEMDDILEYGILDYV